MNSPLPLLCCLIVCLAVPAQGQDDSVLPAWLRFDIEERGRFEGITGLDYVEGQDDAYFLNRLRFNTTLLPTDWLRFHVQVQDSREGGRRQPVPAKVENPFDIRGAYVEIGREDTGWLFRAGRQVLQYGDARLIGPGPWSNVPRVFDGARLAYRRPGVQLEWFAATRAAPDEDDFDRISQDDRIAGFYPTFSIGSTGNKVEPYFLWKGTRNEQNEAGHAGSKNVYAGGLRATGPIPNQFYYTVEAVFEGGNQAGDDLRGWATSLRLGRNIKPAPRAVQLFVEYDYASGDSNPSDNRVGTFDQMFPSNHGKYGIADLMGWRNMHGIRTGVPLQLTGRWKLSVDYHSFWLANLEDYYYRSNGRPVVRNPAATSRHVFQEFDIQNTIAVAKPLDFLFGYAHVFHGQFLKESTGGSPATYAYVQFVITISP